MSGELHTGNICIDLNVVSLVSLPIYQRWRSAVLGAPPRHLPRGCCAALAPAAPQVYPRLLQLAAQSKDPVERLQWVVTYFISGGQLHCGGSIFL